MRRLKSAGHAIRTAWLGAALLSCSTDGPTVPASAGTVRVTGDSVFVGRGARATLVPHGASLPVDSVRWASSDTNVFLVDSTGFIAAVGPGTASIRAEWRGRRSEFPMRAVLRYADAGVRFERLSRGVDRQCAISTEGAVYCGPEVPTSGPVTDSLWRYERLPGGIGLRFTEVHTGFRSVCGLLDDGRIACWGDNDWLVTPPGDPARVVRTDTGPAIVTTDRRFRSLTYGGHAQACGVDVADSRAYCWGHNDFGQLGRGTRTPQERQVVGIVGSPIVRSISTSHFVTCAVLVDRPAACWGQGWGTGATNTITEPRPLLGTVSFDSIRAGWDDACGISVEREAWCWGPNQTGTLGDGTREFRNVPVRVLGGLRWRMLSAPVRGGATCGVAADGEAHCWGSGSRHALLLVDSSRQTVPARMARGVPVTEVSFAAWTTGACLLLEGGRIACL